MRKIFFSFSLLAPFFAFADDPQIQDFNDRLSALENQVKNRTLYNAPAHAQVVNGYNLFITGDFLYWKATENGLTFAVEADHHSGDFLSGKLKLIDPSFRWDCGFRLGAGFNIPHGQWDIYVNWTRLLTGAHKHVRASADGGLLPVWAFPAGQLNIGLVSEAKAFWKLHLNIIDVELGKEFYVGKKLSLRPHLDVRTVFVNQHYTVDYNGINPTIFDQIKIRGNYWGVGPRAGIDMQWNIWKGFSIYGNADISLVYGEFNIHEKEEAPSLPDNQLSFREEMHMARAISGLGIFLGWDHMFGHDEYHFGILAGWEQLMFFEQNQFFRFLDPFYQGSIVSNQGDLMLQGLTISARIDF